MKNQNVINNFAGLVIGLIGFLAIYTLIISPVIEKLSTLSI